MGLFAKSRGPYIHPQTFKSLESFNHDGYQVARRRMRGGGIAWTHIAYLILAVISFKVFLHFEMGAAAYAAKVTELLAAEDWQRFAGMAMQLDPVTQWVIEQVQRVLVTRG